MENIILSLESLERMPSLPRGSHIALMQKCSVSFDRQGFSSGFILLVECINFLRAPRCAEALMRITWKDEVDDILRMAHGDKNEAVEDSAKAVGMLLIAYLTPYKTARQALRGSRIDYYMVDKDAELPFQAQTTAGVEFTGITNNLNGIATRMNEKKRRLPRNRDFPVYIACVEHNFPIACIERIMP